VLPPSRRRSTPHGILNPGKLGLPDPFGDIGWALIPAGARRSPRAVPESARRAMLRGTVTALVVVLRRAAPSS
jgi:hypothetical protein